MRADLDLLCISVYCTADDLLPQRPGERAAQADRRGDRHVVCRAGADGDPERPAVPAGGAPAARASVPAAAQPGCAAQAPRAAGGDDRVADRRVRRSKPGLRATISCCSTRPRSSAAAPSRPPAARSWPTSAATATRKSHSRWFWGMRLHLACAPTAHRAPRRLSLPTGPSARSRCTLLPRALRGGETIVCDKGYAGREFAEAVTALGATLVRPRPRDRARKRPSPRADPATDRVGLLDLQRPPQPRTPRRPHPPQPPRPHRDPAARPRRLHQPQPPTRPPTPRTRRLHRLTTWHQPSRTPAPAAIVERTAIPIVPPIS